MKLQSHTAAAATAAAAAAAAATAAVRRKSFIPETARKIYGRVDPSLPRKHMHTSESQILLVTSTQDIYELYTTTTGYIHLLIHSFWIFL